MLQQKLAILANIVITTNVIALFSSSAHAQQNPCFQTIKFQGAEYTYPTGDPSCSNYDNEKKNFNNFLLGARKYCVDSGELAAALAGDAKVIKDQAAYDPSVLQGDVEGTLGAGDNTFAIGNKYIDMPTEDGNTLGNKYYAKRQTVSMLDSLKPWFYGERCMKLGADDDSCADQTPDVRLESGDVNELLKSNPTQRTSSIGEQVRMACERIDQLSVCNTPEGYNNYLCGNNSTLSNGGATNYDVIGKFKGACANHAQVDEYELEARFQQLTEENQNLLLNLPSTKAAQKFFIVIKPYCPENANNPFNWIRCGIYDTLFPIKDGVLVIQAFAPALPDIAKYLEEDLRKVTPVEEEDHVFGRAKADAGFIPSGSNYKIKLSNFVGDACDPITDSAVQFMGSHTQAFGDTSQPFKLDFKFPSIEEFEQREALRAYKAWIVVPKESYIIEYLSKIKAQRYYPAEFTQALDPDNQKTTVTMIQDIFSSGIKGNTNPAYEMKEVPCPSGSTTQKCYDKTNQSQVNYQRSTPPKGLLGGFRLETIKALWNKMFQAIQDVDGKPNPNYWGMEQCYYNGVKVRNPELAAKLEGDALADLQKCDDVITANINTNASPSNGCTQSLFEKGACPGGADCVDYICGRGGDGGVNGALLVMIAANESGGLFSCASDRSSIKHFGCDPFGAVGYGHSIEEKLQCAINTLSGAADINAALKSYGYPGGINDLPWGLFGLDAASALSDGSTACQQIKAEIYGGNPVRWWKTYCNKFDDLIKETGQQADPSEYSCTKFDDSKPI